VVAIRLASIVSGFVIFGVGLAVGSWSHAPGPPVQGSATERLRPVSTSQDAPRTSGTVYVPVYSSIYTGLVMTGVSVVPVMMSVIRRWSVRHRAA
jgi:hypothetical protein